MPPDVAAIVNEARDTMALQVSEHSTGCMHACVNAWLWNTSLWGPNLVGALSKHELWADGSAETVACA